MTVMRRTQIYLDSDVSEALDRLARKRNTTRSQLIRDAASRYVASENATTDPIIGIIGIGSAPSGCVSEEHDEALAAIAADCAD